MVSSVECKLQTIIKDAYFLGTYQISKEYMKASAELYHADNVFRFPEMIEIKLYIV